jgi:hypothetical protein
VKLHPLLLSSVILDLAKRVFEKINNLGVCFCFFLLTAWSVESLSFSASRASLFPASERDLVCRSCIIACSTFGISRLTVAAEASAAAFLATA